MEKKYQVFVSSTYADLRNERRAVMEALLKLNCIPTGMELFPASDSAKWNLIKDVIAESDYYVVIVAGRYGSLDSEGISYTEREYDCAVELRKPVLGFVHADPAEIPVGKTDSDAEAAKKLQAFRKKVEERMCVKWNSSEQLAMHVTLSLVSEFKRNPGEGWVKSRFATTEQDRRALFEYKERVVALEKQVQAYSVPAEILEKLSKGNDQIEIECDLDVKGQSHRKGPIKISWDEIYRVVGPMLEWPVAWHVFEEGVRVAIALKAMTPEERKKGQNAEANVDKDVLRAIRYHLVALGLVERATKKSSKDDGEPIVGWALSDYGRAYLGQILAFYKTSQK